MALMDAVYRQFQKPSGPLGRIAGWIMDHRASNVERNRWTVDLLNISERDHVLEVGFGPGRSIAFAAQAARRGHVVGIDHSPLMVAVASKKNTAAIRSGTVTLRMGGLELIPHLEERFDKVFSVNVLQFVRDRPAALRAIRAVMNPGATLATTHEPRHLGATADDATRFAEQLSREMADAGFRDMRVERLELKPMPVVCILGRL